jgi:hypothetical protein
MRHITDQLSNKKDITHSDLLNVLNFCRDQNALDNALHNMSKSISVLVIGCVNVHSEAYESTKTMAYDEK